MTIINPNLISQKHQPKQPEPLKPALVIPVDFSGNKVARLLFDKISTMQPELVEGRVIPNEEHEISQMVLNTLLAKKKIMMDAITPEKCRGASVKDLVIGIDKMDKFIDTFKAKAKRSGVSLNTTLNDDDKQRITKLLRSEGV